MNALIGFTAMVVALAGTLPATDAQENSATVAIEGATSSQPPASPIESESPEQIASMEYVGAPEETEVLKERAKSDDEAEPDSASSVPSPRSKSKLLRTRIDPSAVQRQVEAVSDEELCDALVDSARAHDVPVGFFGNLIWQESRFDFGSISRAGAQGVAQFMPGTAAQFGLKNPFDPFEALPASARFLRQLSEQFGNFGLAAAAYNAGPGRVLKWLANRGGLPRETQAYVRIITGRPVEDWRNNEAREGGIKIARQLPCSDMPVFADLKRKEAAEPASPPKEGVLNSGFRRVRDWVARTRPHVLQIVAIRGPKHAPRAAGLKVGGGKINIKIVKLEPGLAKRKGNSTLPKSKLPKVTGNSAEGASKLAKATASPKLRRLALQETRSERSRTRLPGAKKKLPPVASIRSGGSA